MLHKQWNNLFAIEKGTAYEPHMHNTLRLVQEQAGRLNSAGTPVLSLAGLVAKQVKFLAWKIWLTQGMVLAALCAVFFCIHANNTLEWVDLYILPKFLCGCGTVVAMSAIPILKRASRYKMFELEQSTHFAIGGSLLSQLLFIGIGDVCMLTVLALAVGRFGLTIPVTIITLIVPFMTAATACIMLWARTSPSVFQTASVMLCLLSSWLSYEVIDKSSLLQTPARLCLWTGYALICIAVICHEYHNICSYKSVEQMLD